MLTLPTWRWARPRSIAEALELKRAHGAAALFVAGGTDAVPNMKHRLHEPEVVIELGGVAELRVHRETAGALELGPGWTLAELAADPLLRSAYPAVARAAGLVASPQIRNMGTLGGNLCLDTRCTYYNQTFFWREALGFCLKKDGTRCHVVPQGKRCVATHASDVAPVLLALGAEVEIASAARGTRVVPIDAFFVGDGVHNNVLEPDELVTLVRLPAASRGGRSGYQKLRPRGAIDFPMLSVAFHARFDEGRIASPRLVVSALGARPRLVGRIEEALGAVPEAAGIARAAELAHKQCLPLTNIPYDEAWRRDMVPVFVRRVLRDAFPEVAHDA